MPVYKWKEDFRFPTPAQLAGERLETIREKNGGKLTPKDVVEDSRPEDSPLHHCFEWDDEKAAESFRLNQARAIINHVVAVVQHDEKEYNVRAFVSVTTKGSDRHYTSMGYAMSQEDLRKQVVQSAWRELEGWKNRYKEYEELSTVFNAIDAVKVA